MSGKPSTKKVAATAAAVAPTAAQPPKTPTKASPAPKAEVSKSVSPAPAAKVAKASPAPKAAKAPRSTSAPKKTAEEAVLVPSDNAPTSDMKFKQDILELIMDLAHLANDDIKKRVKKIAKVHNIILNRRKVKEADEYNGVKNPRKPCSAFMFYVKENREKLVSEKPELSFAEIGKELGKLWQATNATERAKFTKLANDDKERYETENVAFKAAKAAHEAAQ
jgi:hypothetical protein